ncbi:MAG: ATP-binding protein [Gammaproteobacteria bacterium]|nr:ATP-binding protein [Gammaproteobacteria bacterium]
MKPLPDNPFRPGFGRLPPFLAGRDHEKGYLRTLLHCLRVGERDSEAVLLHGPRGNGKTAILRWLQLEASDKFNLRQIKAHFVSNPTVVVENLLGSHRDESREETMHGTIGGGVPGVLRSEGTRQLTRRQTVSLSLDSAMKQTARGKPLLMIMDEAHTADPAGMGVFLNAFQDSAGMAPMRLVLAGTSDVRDVLSAADATFADRINQLPIGLLSPAAGRAAITEPFAGHGIDAAGGVVERLAAWADNYPYFLQLVGEAAWMETANFGRLTGEAGEAAIEQARVPRNRYYSTRYEELAASGHLEFGVAIAAAVGAGGHRIKKVDVEEIARQHCGKGWSAAVDFIVRKGFLWRPHLEPDFQAGIPSLMDYTVKRHERE